MGVHGDNVVNVVIGVPELYIEMKDMKQEFTDKLDKSDEENRKRDEANQKEIRGWFLGNGKEGAVTKIEKNKANIVLLFKLFFLIFGSILTVAFFVIRSGILS